jgi:hypothetical protein
MNRHVIALDGTGKIATVMPHQTILYRRKPKPRRKRILRTREEWARRRLYQHAMELAAYLCILAGLLTCVPRSP